MTGRMFFGGIPTEPDVRRLMDRFGDPGPGMLIEYETLEKEIGKPRTSSRFRTVVSAWRARLLKEHNRVGMAVPSRGIRILREEERAGHAASGHRRGVRQVVRSARDAALIRLDQLSGDARTQAEQVQKVGGDMAQAAVNGARVLAAIMRPPTQLPRKE